MSDHTFGELISQYLARKRLKQSHLAEGTRLAPSTISEMCIPEGTRLKGTKLRERVVKIIAWLWEQGALTTLTDANALFKAAGLSGLTAEDGIAIGKPDLRQLLAAVPHESTIFPAVANPLEDATQNKQAAFGSIETTAESSLPELSLSILAMDITRATLNIEFTSDTTEIAETAPSSIDHSPVTPPLSFSTAEPAVAHPQPYAPPIPQSEPLSTRHPDRWRISASLIASVALLAIIGLIWIIGRPDTNVANSSHGLTISTVPTPIGTNIKPSGTEETVPTIVTVNTPAPANPASGIDTSFQNITPTASISASVTLPICGVSPPILDTTLPDDRFRRDLGVSMFTPENTQGGVQSDYVRAVAIDARGLWFGMFTTAEHPGGVGFSFYDRVNAKRYWVRCDHPDGPQGKNINALVIDQRGYVWAGAEKGGLFRFDGQEWVHYGLPELPNDEIFGLYVDMQGILWVGTWEGVAKFDGSTWTTPYLASQASIFDNHIHAFAIDGDNNIWIGHVDAGVSLFTNSTGKWTHVLTNTSDIGGNQIRGIVVQPAKDTEPESVWIATRDGGVSRFQQGEWRVYQVADGLPSNDVESIALDSLNRIWIGTTGGASYFDGERWIAYHTLDTRALVIGQPCTQCPFDADHIWTGTIASGLTHSRLPFPDQVFAVAEICMELLPQRLRTCEPSPPVTQLLTTDVITFTYSKPLTPGQKLVLGVTMIPQAPYQIIDGREFLSNTDADDRLRFGAHHRTTATANADPGQPYTFMDYSEPFTMPILVSGAREQTFVSSWRVWSRTRYAGPEIRVVLTVKQ